MLHNYGTCSAAFSLSFEDMDRANRQNYDFPVFRYVGKTSGLSMCSDQWILTWMLMTGQVDAGKSIPLPIVFQPLEEKVYEFDVILHSDEESTETRTIQARGILPSNAPPISLPHDTSRDASTHPPAAKMSLPALMCLSDQMIDFGSLQTQAGALFPREGAKECVLCQNDSIRIVEAINPIEDDISFQFNAEAFHSAAAGQLDIDPMNGRLSPGQRQSIVFRYRSSSGSEIFQGEIYILLTREISKFTSEEDGGENEEDVIAIHPTPPPPRCLFYRALHQTVISVARDRTEKLLRRRLPLHLASTFSSRTKSDVQTLAHETRLLETMKVEKAGDIQNEIISEMLVIDVHGRVVRTEPAIPVRCPFDSERVL